MENRQFIERLSERVKMEKDQTGRMIDLLCEVISDTVAEEDIVVVPSFGSFEPKKKLERVVVHPTTARKMLVPPRLTLGFKPAAALKNEIKEG
ncbi:MAG: HU family DNA-binding protein [Bacteroides sp.]|nr:HU family DNA-binding protein [Bacteroides sp.]MDE7441174.1 HU family DNA-binding protein [Muribaculaceae bacterium]